MTSHAKTFLKICRFRTDSRVNGLGERIGHLFERLGLSVRKKFASVRTAQAIRAKKICIRLHSSGYPCEQTLHPFERLGLSVRKKSASVRTAQAIRAKNKCIRSNGLGYPLEKSCDLFERPRYPFKTVTINFRSS